MNEPPAFESRRVRTQPRTVTDAPTGSLPPRMSETDETACIAAARLAHPATGDTLCGHALRGKLSGSRDRRKQPERRPPGRQEPPRPHRRGLGAEDRLPADARPG